MTRCCALTAVLIHGEWLLCIDLDQDSFRLPSIEN
jgi:hypothetical protein